MQFRNFIASLAIASTVLATPIDLSRRDEGGCPGFKQVVQTVWEKRSEGTTSATNSNNAPATVSSTAAPSVASEADGNEDIVDSASQQDSAQADQESNSQSDSDADAASEADDETNPEDAQPSTTVSTSAASSTVLETTTVNGSPSVITSTALETQFITITFTPSQSSASETMRAEDPTSASSSASADPSVTTATVVETEVVNLPVFGTETTSGGSSVIVSTLETTRPVTRTRTETVTVINTIDDQNNAGATESQGDSTSVVTVTRSTFVPVSTIVSSGSISIVQTLIPATFTTTFLVTETPQTKADAVAGSASVSSSSSLSACTSTSAGGYGSMPQSSSDSSSDSSDDNSNETSDSNDDSSDDNADDNADSNDSSSDSQQTTGATTLVIDNTLTVAQSLGAIATQGPTSVAGASTKSDDFTSLPSDVAKTLAAEPTGQPHRDINDPDYQQAWVKAHNDKRHLHGTPDVHWSDDLAKSALIIGENCIFQHNQTVGGGGYGQNLNAITGANDSPEAAVNSWYSEEPKFANDYGNASPSSSFHDWGHFTQVVWKSTTEIGCATVTCKNGLALAWPDRESDITVCNYRVAGNVDTQYADNVPRPQ